MNSGNYIETGKGYKAFVPEKLNAIEKDLDLSDIQALVDRANLAVGELRALEKMLPNPKLLTADAESPPPIIE